jgi:hypothetical protein
MQFFKSAGCPRSLVLVAIFCLFSWLAIRPVLADDTTGSKGTVLNGSLEDKAKMESSLKLLVDPPSTTPMLPAKLNVQQFSGGAQYSPGQPAPKLPPPPARPVLQSGVGFQNPIFRQPPTITPSFVPPPRFVPPPVPRWNYTMTPRNGIMTYSPGLAVKKIAQPTILQRHANLTLAFPNTNAQAIIPTTNLQMMGTGAHVTQWAPEPVQMKATELSLVPRIPQKHLAPPINWQAWYQRVLHAVYADWRNDAVGAGKTTLLLTVYDTKNVDCKVIDFSPADGANRDAKAETAFRESALKTITSLDGNDIWAFPVAAIRPKKIVFDMQFDHAVGATPGCAVVHTHSNAAMRALQR